MLQESKIIKKNLSSFDRIVAIGDLHGSWNPLEAFFREHHISESTHYIFVGDYLARGSECADIVDFLYILMTQYRENVTLIRGNHEVMEKKELEEYRAYLKTNIPYRKGRFIRETLPQIKHLMRKYNALQESMVDVLYFEYGGARFVATHYGLRDFKDNTPFNKKRKCARSVDKLFEANREKNQYQIHGHCKNEEGVVVYGNSINVDSSYDVEFGGYLNIVIISEDNKGDSISIKAFKYRNRKYNRLTLEYIARSPLISREEIIEMIIENFDATVKNYGANSVVIFQNFPQLLIFPMSEGSSKAYFRDPIAA